MAPADRVLHTSWYRGDRLHLSSGCSMWGRGGEPAVLTDARPRANTEGGTQKWGPSHLKEVIWGCEQQVTHQVVEGERGTHFAAGGNTMKGHLCCFQVGTQQCFSAEVRKDGRTDSRLVPFKLIALLYNKFWHFRCHIVFRPFDLIILIWKMYSKYQS